MNKNQIMRLLGEADATEINNPRWDLAGIVHDWRSYIAVELQEIWDNISYDAKIVAYYIAKEQARNEDWD